MPKETQNNLVTQLEFSRHLDSVEQDLNEIKASLIKLNEKIDRINEDKLPSIREQVTGLSVKQKSLVAVISSVWGIVGSILVAVVKGLFGA